LIALLWLLSLCAYAQQEATTKDGKKVILNKNGTWKYAKPPAKTTSAKVPAATGLKKEAFNFSMQVVGSYFSNDCAFYHNSLADEIILMKGVFPVSEEIKTKMCESLAEAVVDKSKTLQDYKNTYTIELLTRGEVEVKAGQKLPDHFNTIDNEFYFLGFETKPGLGGNSKFTRDRMFAFLVRQVNGTWKVKGLLND
jgi:hypothetical protein